MDWYRNHDRLHTGDPIAMAADSLEAYRADVAAGNDALLVCDSWAMADALNRHIHDESIVADAPTVSTARAATASASGISSSAAAPTPPSPF